MDVFRTENNCLKFHYDAEELWIQPWGANITPASLNCLRSSVS